MEHVPEVPTVQTTHNICLVMPNVVNSENNRSEHTIQTVHMGMLGLPQVNLDNISKAQNKCPVDMPAAGRQLLGRISCSWSMGGISSNDKIEVAFHGLVLGFFQVIVMVWHLEVHIEGQNWQTWHGPQ